MSVADAVVTADPLQFLEHTGTCPPRGWVEDGMGLMNGWGASRGWVEDGMGLMNGWGAEGRGCIMRWVKNQLEKNLGNN